MEKIETNRLILRPILESDAEEIYEYSKNENVGKDAGWKPHTDLNETREIMNAIFLNKENTFGIILRETGKLFGSIGLVTDAMRDNDKTRMIGYSIAEKYWRKGYTSEAVQALVQYGFEKLGLDLISATCYPYNEGSRGVLKKCGFQYEGCLRLAELRYDGLVFDHECYARYRE